MGTFLSSAVGSTWNPVRSINKTDKPTRQLGQGQPRSMSLSCRGLVYFCFILRGMEFRTPCQSDGKSWKKGCRPCDTSKRWNLSKHGKRENRKRNYSDSNIKHDSNIIGDGSASITGPILSLVQEPEDPNNDSKRVRNPSMLS